MKTHDRQFTPWILLSFLACFMVYPLAYVLIRAFWTSDGISLRFFTIMLGSEYYREVICNSLNLAIAVTTLVTLIAYPIALTISRLALPASILLHAGLLLPLVVPPFVGVLGIRQIFGRFGVVNLLLIQSGIITSPIDWLGGGGISGIVTLQVLHLVPIMYLSLSASLRNVHVALEEAATMCGATRTTLLRRVTLPLSLPGWYAGAVLVFVSSFTDLGTPLVFEYRHVLPVQIFNMLSDLNENAVGYSFVVFTCTLCALLFYLSQSAALRGSFSGTGRSHQGSARIKPTPWVGWTLATLLILYIALSSLPHVGVLLLATSEKWFMSALPERFTISHFVEVLHHPMTLRSLINSIGLSLCATLLTIIAGYIAAHIVVRSRMRSRALFELLCMIPLAVPGIVFAFGYIGAFAGTFLDARLNPFPLLIAAYVVRRVPNMNRSASAGLQEATVVMEEAARMVGAGHWLIFRKIVLPLIRRHILAGAVLTFAYSMLEVSDGLLLALEERFYPISKAMYVLMARPDGLELASALGVMVMVLMICAFAAAEILVSPPRTPSKGATPSPPDLSIVRSKSKSGLVQVMLVCGFLSSLPFISGGFALTNACAESADTGRARTSAREIVLVSPHWEGVKREFEQGFSQFWRAKTGEDVTFRWLDVGGTSDIVRYVRTQFKVAPSGIGVDLIFGGGTDPFIDLDRDGVLAPVQVAPEILKDIPSNVAGAPLYNEKHTWFAAALSTFGILYNKRAVAILSQPVPVTWRDLSKPEYHGLVAAGDPRKSGSMHAMYEIILQGYGWNEGWSVLQGLAANVRNFSGGATQIGKEIAVGEVNYGLAIDTYAGEIIRRIGADNLGYVVPYDLPAVNGDGIGLLRGAPNAELATAFVNFVLSTAGQTIWYGKLGSPGGPTRFELGKLPIQPRLYGVLDGASVVHDNPFTWPSKMTYDAALGARRWNIVNDLFGAFIIDVHDRLSAVHRGTDGTESALAEPPIDESTIERTLASGLWSKDPAYRSTTLREWGDAARLRWEARTTRSFLSLRNFRWIPPLALATLMIFLIARRFVGRLSNTARPT